MSFEQPWWLFAILPALGVAAYHWRVIEKSRASLIYPATASIQSYSCAQFWVRRFPLLLKSAALCLIIGAMARPQNVSRESAGLTEGIDILLVLDTSMSMLAEDFDPVNRMTAAVESARNFIRGRVHDRIGILVFGSAPLLTTPLTLDHSALQDFLDEVQPGMVDQKGTAIGDGIASAVNHLKETVSKSKVMILLTDGSSNTGLLDPVTAAKLAKTFGIKIYAIGTAKHGMAYATVQDPVFGARRFQIRDDLDEDTLLKISAETDGKYFRATNSAQLKDIYAEIDKLEKYEFDKPEFVSRHDLYPWLLYPALLVLLLEILLSRTILLRIP